VRNLNKRQKKILRAARDLGGPDNEFTTSQVADKTGLNANGIAQTLGALTLDIECLGGTGGDTKWKLKKNDSQGELF
jgi:hypothetical protein